MYRIIKFGGSVLSDAESLFKTASIIESYPDKRIIVCSALKNVTASLLQALSEKEQNHQTFKKILLAVKEKHILLLKETVSEKEARNGEKEIAHLIAEALLHLDLAPNSLTLPEAAFLILLGERLSCLLLKIILQERGLKAVIRLPEEIPLVTDGRDHYPRIDFKHSGGNLKRLTGFSAITLVPGFYAISPGGKARLLGRGGSDYTAASLGYLLDAASVDLWKDVDGFFSGDPAHIDAAVLQHSLDYEEAAELSYYGARILHPETIPPLRSKKIPLRLYSFASSSSPTSPHTLIHEKKEKEGSRLTGIASLDNIGIITVGGGDVGDEPGILAQLAGTLNDGDINIKSVLTSQTCINILVDGTDLEKAHRLLKNNEETAGRRFSFDKSHSLISLVGNGISSTPGIAACAFQSLAEKKISVRMICGGASPVSVYFIVHGSQCKEAVHVVHDAFFNTKEAPYETSAVH